MPELHFKQSAPSGLPILLLHGLFGDGDNLGVIARQLAADGYRVISPDLRNHGRSPWADNMAYPEMAGDVGQREDAVLVAGGQGRRLAAEGMHPPAIRC